jgi:hypothetical protein
VPQILSTKDAAQLLGVPTWRLDDAVRRGEVAPSLFSGNRVWLPEDVQRVRAALAFRGVHTVEVARAEAQAHERELHQRDIDEAQRQAERVRLDGERLLAELRLTAARQAAEQVAQDGRAMLAELGRARASAAGAAAALHEGKPLETRLADELAEKLREQEKTIEFLAEWAARLLKAGAEKFNFETMGELGQQTHQLLVNVVGAAKK